MFDTYEGRYAVFEVNGENACFIPRCPKCGRWVKATDIHINGLDEIKDEPNAICTIHGAVKMYFDGWFSDEELKE